MIYFKKIRLLLLVFVLLPSLIYASVKNYSYQYDQAGRLVNVQTENQQIEYQYDDASTITSRDVSAIGETVFADGFESPFLKNGGGS